MYSSTLWDLVGWERLIGRRNEKGEEEDLWEEDRDKKKKER